MFQNLSASSFLWLKSTAETQRGLGRTEFSRDWLIDWSIFIDSVVGRWGWRRWRNPLDQGSIVVPGHRWPWAPALYYMNSFLANDQDATTYEMKMRKRSDIKSRKNSTPLELDSIRKPHILMTWTFLISYLWWCDDQDAGWRTRETIKLWVRRKKTGIIKTHRHSITVAAHNKHDLAI